MSKLIAIETCWEYIFPRRAGARAKQLAETELCQGVTDVIAEKTYISSSLIILPYLYYAIIHYEWHIKWRNIFLFKFFSISKLIFLDVVWFTYSASYLTKYFQYPLQNFGESSWILAWQWQKIKKSLLFRLKLKIVLPYVSSTAYIPAYSNPFSKSQWSAKSN